MNGKTRKRQKHAVNENQLMSSEFKEVLNFCILSSNTKSVCTQNFWKSYIKENIYTERLPFDELRRASGTTNSNLKDAINEYAISYILNPPEDTYSDPLDIYRRLFERVPVLRKIIMKNSLATDPNDSNYLTIPRNNNYDNVLDKLFEDLKSEPLDNKTQTTKAWKAYHTLQSINTNAEMQSNPDPEADVHDSHYYMTEKEREINGRMYEFGIAVGLYHVYWKDFPQQETYNQFLQNFNQEVNDKKKEIMRTAAPKWWNEFPHIHT